MKRAFLSALGVVAPLSAWAQSVPVMLGCGCGDPGGNGGSQAMVQAVTGALGQAPTAINTYVDFNQGSLDGGYSATGAAKSGMMPIVGIPMAMPGHDADADFKAIASSQWDGTINKILQQYSAAGYKQFWIRLGWEMSGDWYPWSVTPANAADFKAAFQHIATLAHQFTGSMVGVVWNPSYGPAAAPYMSYFPGAQYIDSVGIDIYGQGSGVPSTAPYDTSTDPNTYTLTDAIALAKQTGLPLSLPETGAGPGDSVFPAALADVLSKSHVPVSFMSVWDDPTGGAGPLDWTGSSSESAWKAAVTSIQANNKPDSATAVANWSASTSAANVAMVTSTAPIAPASTYSTTAPASVIPTTAPAYADVASTPVDTSGCVRATINGTAGITPQTGGSTDAPKSGYVQWYPAGTSKPTKQGDDE
jgi:hypothetical protein